MRVTDKLITPAADMVVSLEEFKRHLRWPSSDISEDTLMTTYIQAATTQAEQFTSRQFNIASWRALFDKFYCQVTLTMSPVDIDSIVIKYFDSNGAEQTLAATEYKIREGGEYGLTSIEFDGTLPPIYDKPNAVFVDYNAGYETVPAPIKAGIMIQAASYFENRMAEVSGTTVTQVMYGAYQLWYPYKTFYNNL